MQVITAPETVDGYPTVFLAGGITNCPEWQDEIIARLSQYDNAILLNPRRKNFPIDDPNAAREQITWEFHALNNATIFSIWFSGGESDQPICMYELGRHLERFKNTPDRVVIGIEDGYNRKQDVEIQTKLVSPRIASRIVNSLPSHAEAIVQAVEELNSQQYKFNYISK